MGIYFDTRPSKYGAWGVDTSKRPLENPYFVSLASRPRHCPSCQGVTVWESTRNPDSAYESCPKCGWFQTWTVPDEFAGRRCAPVGAESALPVDLEMDEARRRARLGVPEPDPPKAGEVIQFRPRG